MCESKVFLIEGRKKEKIMDEAVLVKDEGSKITLTGLLGDRRKIKNARIVGVNAEKHEIFIKKISNED
ncbi:MAG: CooT family nickel-binding protein [Candidatus Hydrothermarchaeota archaeon]|nr:CooT family nickel-binding protein [Candidatus Hydrothermarchaeota archaeon]